ncbi:MAG: gliding motility lipoprotein GldH [Flavobacteriales bacterium]
MRYVVFILSITCILSSCDSNRIYEKNITIKNNLWSIDTVPSFEFNNQDTISEQVLKINIRHSSDYAYSNLWLFIHTHQPDGNILTDTLECILAEKDGRWKGSGLGDIWDLKSDFKTETFDQIGTYRVEIEQAMRYGDLAKIEKLFGIMSVGFRIQKSE